MRSPDRPPAPARTLAATRRAFLGWAGSTAAFTTLASLRPLVAAADPASAPAAGFFDERESEILTQIMERVVYTGLADAPRVRDTGAVASVDALCAGLDPSLTGLLPPLVRAFEYAPILFDLTFSRFTHMSDAEKDASLEAWRTSRLALRRTAFLAVRNLCFFGWYAQPESWPLIGYRGPLLGGGTA